MTTLLNPIADSTSDTIRHALLDLKAGAARLAALPLDERMQLAASCAIGISEVARDWVEAACQAKRIPPGSPFRAEEITAGPVAVLRYLRLLCQTLDDVRRHGRPVLPGPVRTVDGQLRVPVVPTRALFDRIVFQPMRAETWLDPSAELDQVFGRQLDCVTGKSTDPPTVTLVLGAGNVSSIPLTDALTKVFQYSHAVLLKMNPVNGYLGPFFEQACKSLVQSGFLRIVYGGASVGASLIEAPDVNEVHITGSCETHDRIVWGSDEVERRQRKANGTPLLEKSITSELGNVTPWIVVPGKYTESQLKFQAENIAASITNNASFNCVATKVVVTWERWPERNRFLDLLQRFLADVPPRYAYYPGAAERYGRFSGVPADPNERTELPWTLLRDVAPSDSPDHFREESFVCVCVETALDAPSEQAFLEQAVDFANDELWGTLAATLTVPDSLRKRPALELNRALARLRYGTIGVNQWPGIAFALMSPPWGGFPDGAIDNVQSGIGWVHNTYLLEKPQKTVLSSPLTIFPKPMWFPTHRRPEAVAWRLFDLYRRPRVWRLPALLGTALHG